MKIAAGTALWKLDSALTVVQTASGAEDLWTTMDEARDASADLLDAQADALTVDATALHDEADRRRLEAP
jgi:hypothetical protein